MNIRDILIANDSASYGKDYKSHYLEIYKLHVQMADNVSNRRQSANSFFLTVNTAIIGVTGYVGGTAEKWNWIIGLMGLVLCFAWYRLIRAYQDLNSGKFKVLHEIEKGLPLSPYDAEWEALGRGRDPSLYLPVTHIERTVPAIIAVLHGIVFIWSNPWREAIAIFPVN
jgi:hypothetical protein